MTHWYDSIPELAGLATYDDAARVGYSVDENVARLMRYHWVERRMMAALVAHLPAEPVWEIKCAMALHQWECAERVDRIRSRIAEMRNPVPRLDAAPDPAIDAFLDELLRSRNTAELLAGMYGVAFPALRDAYAEHVRVTNPVVDHPTRRMLRIGLAELDETVTWGRSALHALHDAEGTTEADAWTAHLSAYLDAAGGIAGPAPQHGSRAIDLPAPRSARPFVSDFHPRRDARFAAPYNFEFPPHIVYNLEGVPADERNLALLCKRTLEMDVPEMMASFMTERDDQPWEFHRDYARQLWDEARHAMMGSIALEARGIDWKGEIPLNISFALRLNLHAEPRERQEMLFAIEQSLMPADTGKRFEFETARDAGDALSAHFHDYDWADEVLHAQIGRRALRREGISSDVARDRAKATHDKTWAALDQYRHRERQSGAWWAALVQRVLGRPSAAPDIVTAPPGAINVFSE
jgi:hypothetical protein